MCECERAAARSLTNIFLPSLRARQYHGVGRAAVAEHCQDPGGAMLLSDAVSSCNRVRLFTKRCAEEPYWREQEGWMKDYSVQSVNARLAAVEPYKRNPELRKETYGAKSKGIYVQYAKTVPAQCVPDRFEIPKTRHTGRLPRRLHQTSMSLGLGTPARGTEPAASPQASQTVDGGSRQESNTRGALSQQGGGGQPAVGNEGQSCVGGGQEDRELRAAGNAADNVVTGSGSNLAPPPPPLKMVRWSGAVHGDALVRALLSAPFLGHLPKKLSGWESPAEMMAKPVHGQAWDVQTLKEHAEFLANKRMDIFA